MEIDKKDVEILKAITKHFGKEFAICKTIEGDKFLIEGDLSKVEVPTNLKCKYVIHSHTLNPHPSEADLKASEKIPVCLIYNNIVRCFFNRKELKPILK